MVENILIFICLVVGLIGMMYSLIKDESKPMTGISFVASGTLVILSFYVLLGTFL